MNKQEAKKAIKLSLKSPLGLLSTFCLISTTFTLSAYADINTARTYISQGKASQALIELEGDIASNPNDPEARFLKGVALQSMGNTDAAIEVYSGLVADFPELPEPHNNLAVLFADKKEFGKAENALRAAIKTNESYATAYENLGDIYAQRASIAYTDALTRDPANRAAVELKLNIIDRILLPPSAQKPIPVQVASNNPVQTIEPIQAPQQNTSTQTASTANVDTGALRSTLMSWANAWSSRDVTQYLSHYADSYRPVGNASRAVWAKYRAERLQAPSFIIVNIDQLQFTSNSDNSVTASFVQDYQSDGYQDAVRKTMKMVNTAQGWKIQREESKPL